jgi:hypothetical protein
MLRGWPIFPRFSPWSGQRYGQSPQVKWNACTRPNYAVQLLLSARTCCELKPNGGFIALALMTSSETKCSSRSSNEMRVSFFRRKSRAFRFLHSETEQCNLHARVQHQMLAHRLFFFRIRILYHLKIIKSY